MNILCKNTIYFTIILILFILILYYRYNIYQNSKPYLWQYWDNIDNNETPAYIKLCLETVDRNCSNSFKIIRLNKYNIESYIPEISKYKNQIDKLNLIYIEF